MYELQGTYNTKTEADIFVRVYNLAVQSGRVATTVQVRPGQYQVWLTL